SRENAAYLPGFKLAPPIVPTADLERALKSGQDFVVFAVPSHAVRETATRASSAIAPGALVVSAAKGIEEGTSLRMSEVLGQTISPPRPIAVLSGPSFAREVAAEMPTVVTATSADPATAAATQRAFASPMFRVYASEDLIGVE